MLYYWHKGDKQYWIWAKIAQLLPNGLVYAAAIRLVAHATSGKYSSTEVAELPAMDAIKRWENDYQL